MENNIACYYEILNLCYIVMELHTEGCHVKTQTGSQYQTSTLMDT